jgi:DNA-binding MarR family transcriptional regulator
MKRNSNVRARTDSQTAVRLRLVVARLARAIRQHGAANLTPSQLSALSTIEDYGPIRVSDLAARESVSAPVATRVVASLQELSYVERIEDSTDRRVCLIKLTRNGRGILNNLWRERTAGLNARIDALSAHDVNLLQAALPVLEELVRENEFRDLGTTE